MSCGHAPISNRFALLDALSHPASNRSIINVCPQTPSVQKLGGKSHAQIVLWITGVEFSSFY